MVSVLLLLALQGFKHTDQGTEIHWDKADLPIMVVVSTDSVGWYAQTAKAVDFWNRTLGINVFVLAHELHPEAKAYTERSEGIVPVLRGDHPYTHVRALQLSGVMLAAPIYLPEWPLVQVEPNSWWAVAHELGHVLGLDHGTGLMSPNLDILLNKMPPVIPEDIACLKRRYVN